MDMKDLQRNSAPALLKGALAGAAAGVFASWTMNQVYALWTKFTGNCEQPEQSAQRGVSTDPATIAMVNELSRRFLGRELTGEQAKLADLIGHYMIGIVGGALYGASSEYLPQLRVGAGAAFGAAFFLLGEEIAVPLLGFSARPWQIPAENHALGLLAHLVYGVSAELARRGGNALLAS